MDCIIIVQQVGLWAIKTIHMGTSANFNSKVKTTGSLHFIVSKGWTIFKENYKLKIC
jgi:hypothetical protein